MSIANKMTTNNPTGQLTRPAERALSQDALAAIGLAAVFALGVGYAWMRPHHPPPEHFEGFLVDPSKSVRADTLCADLRRLGHKIYREDGGALTLTVYSTSDRQTSGNEPLLVGTVKRERQARLLEQNRSSAREDEFAGNLNQLCEKLKARDESPIRNGISSTLRSFPTDKCRDANVHCRLFIHTDGLETFTPHLRAAMTSLKVQQRGGEPLLENRNIEVVFCGLSERKGRLSGAPLPSIAFIEQAWRPEFASQQNLRFEPTCAPMIAE